MAEEQNIGYVALVTHECLKGRFGGMGGTVIAGLTIIHLPIIINPVANNQ